VTCSATVRGALPLPRLERGRGPGRGGARVHGKWKLQVKGSSRIGGEAHAGPPGQAGAIFSDCAGKSDATALSGGLEVGLLAR